MNVKLICHCWVTVLLTLLLAATPAVAGTAQDHSHDHDQTATHSGDRGVVDFGVSCSEEVQDDFDEALALVHHMMYEQAREEFQQITERAPECAMAHWGVAMTRFQPLWPTRPDAEALAAGHQEVQKAMELGPGSERERALVAAAEAFYREPETASWWTRIERWAEAMESAHQAHGEDLDVMAFYALSRLAVAPRAEDRTAEHAEAAQVLLEVYQEQPKHPGAIHYTIHANDMSGRAGESLQVVRSYSDIAPDVPHALHMPTHIFVRLGEWPEVIEWNVRSADAALRHPAGDKVSHHYPHATDYLLYAHLQRAEDERAKAVLEETLAKGPYQDSFISAFHLAVMPARYAVERRDWEAAARIESREPAGLSWDAYPWPEAMSWLARGLGSIHTGALDKAKAAEKRIAELESKTREDGEETMATYIEIDRRILAGFIAHAEGDDEKAVDLLRSAAKLEATVEKHPVTPGALLPPYEALGDLQLDLGRAAEALEAYESSLDVWPGRYRSLLGAARAAAAADRPGVAQEHYAELLEIVGEPAEPRPGLVEARKYLANGAPSR